MSRKKLWFGLAGALALLVIIASAASRRAGGVDAALVGTWQLQWPGRPIYWDIRTDGTYAVSGPGAGPGHAGRFKAAAGKWSLRSPVWKDGGTYAMLGPNAFSGVGKLGPGTWMRAGTPAAPLVQASAAPRSAPAARQARMSDEESERYIADYNAQWEKAAQGLRRLTTRAPRSSGSGGDWAPGSYSSSDSGNNAEAEAAARAAYEQRAVESRAYWGGSSDDYNRILNGECNSSDASRYGC